MSLDLGVGLGSQPESRWGRGRDAQDGREGSCCSPSHVDAGHSSLTKCWEPLLPGSSSLSAGGICLPLAYPRCDHRGGEPDSLRPEPHVPSAGQTPGCRSAADWLQPFTLGGQ